MAVRLGCIVRVVRRMAPSHFFVLLLLLGSIILAITTTLKMMNNATEGVEQFRRNIRLEKDGMGNYVEACRCVKRSVGHEFARLAELAMADPYEVGTSRAVLLRRHPNVGPQLLANISHCQNLPFLTGLSWDGVWQLASIRTTDSVHNYRLYSASCDIDKNGRCSAVRLVTLVDAMRPEPPFCYLWTNTSVTPTVVTATSTVFVDYQGVSNHLLPHLITCPVPASVKQVTAVSIAAHKCETVTNFLEIPVNQTKLPRKNMSSVVRGSGQVSSLPEVAVQVSSLPEVAVCGPAIFYYHSDISHNLVEWLEILKALKVSKVFLYLTKAHPNIEKVIRHYEERGFVSVTWFSYPSPYVNEPILRRAWVGVERSKMFGLENTYFTDCLLRNRHQYRYLLHLDPDELPIMGKYNNIRSFVGYVASRIRDKKMNIQLPWRVFHVDSPAGPSAANIPKEMFFLRHNLYRKHCPKDECGKYKTIYDTRHTLAAYSHEALLCNGRCRKYRVPASTAYLAHYRRNCTDNRCDGMNFLEEQYLLPFASRVIKAVNNTLKRLKLNKYKLK